jgi:hypothetical protein
MFRPPFRPVEPADLMQPGDLPARLFVHRTRKA